MKKAEKVKKENVIKLPTNEDFGPAQRLKNGTAKLEQRETSLVGKVVTAFRAMNPWEAKVDVYYRHGKIDELQHQAAIKFRQYWQRGVEGIRTNESTGGTYDAHDFLNKNSVARERLKQASDSLSPKRYNILVTVCAYDNPAGTATTDRINVLRNALDDLIAIWSMA
jgi:hypothetical protein